MIPATYPSVLDANNRTKMVVYELTSVTGLTRWVDYIPVKSPANESDTTLANTYANAGFILSNALTSVTGLQAFKDYIPIYVDNAATVPWTTDANGYIPLSDLFSISSLFANNEQGLWYDPSDFASMFQDAAGTIPVTTVEQPVGLIIDKRNGGVLNPQLVTNSTFDTDTDWTKGTGWAIGSGVATKTAGVASLLSQSETLVAGKTYRIVYTITRTAGTFTVQFRGGSTISGTARSASGTYVDFITAVSGNNSLNFEGSSLFAGTVDNVYMREVTGNDGCQTTSASRPTLSALYNLITYSEQFNNAPWIVANSTSTDPVITANNVIAPNGYQTADTIVFGAIDDAGDYSVVSQVLTLPATQNYTRSLYIKATSAGDIGKKIYFYVTDVTIKDVVTITLTADWQRVTKTLSMASGGGKSFTFGTLGSSLGGANQVSVSADVWGYQVVPENDGVGLLNYQRVNTATDYDTTGFPPYLSYDGTDDHLLSQTVNLNTNTSDGLAIRNLLTLPAKFDNTAWTKTNSFVQSNLLLYSEDFSNAAWSKSALNVVSNSVASPTGTLTADTLTCTTSTSSFYVSQSSNTAGENLTNTVSCYLKSNTAQYAYVSLSANTTTNYWATAVVDLTSGTITQTTNGAGVSGAVTSISNLGNGWYKVIVTGTFGAIANNFGMVVGISNTATPTMAAYGVYSWTASGTESIYVWGGQATKGLVTGDYRKTDGVAAPVLYSNYNGTVSAQKLVEDTANNSHAVVQTSSNTGGVFSFYAKAGERTFVFAYAETINQGRCFDLTSGTVGSIVLGTPLASSITSVGNGWYRCSITLASNTGAVRIGTCSADGVFSYTGDGTSGIYISNSQLEVGTSATAYQTVGTDAVTVWAGQRKLRDTGNPAIVSNVLTPTGTNIFTLYAPNGVSVSYRFTNTGTLSASAGNSIFASAPSTDVLTAIGDISGDITTLRVDGVLHQTVNTDLGTGNYRATSQFSIGKSSSSHYQGRIYSLIVRMTASTDTQIANTENYVNSKTKAY